MVEPFLASFTPVCNYSLFSFFIMIYLFSEKCITLQKVDQAQGLTKKLIVHNLLTPDREYLCTSVNVINLSAIHAFRY